MITKSKLEQLYRKYNQRKFVTPDPLQLLYNYPNVRDREIAGLIASSLAYGRVAQILKSVDKILSKMGDSPYSFLKKTTPAKIKKTFSGFKHRFTTDSEITSLLIGTRRIIAKKGSLNKCFTEGLTKSDSTVLIALEKFSEELNCEGNYLIPHPARGSACKRLNLYLRWMVRKDSVDPGGWKNVSPCKLIIPLDTHMARIGKSLNLTSRKSANIKMAMEITNAFKKISPEDPVKYDFTLTRAGIHPELNMDILDIFQK